MGNACLHLGDFTVGSVALTPWNQTTIEAPMLNEALFLLVLQQRSPASSTNKAFPTCSCFTGVDDECWSWCESTEILQREMLRVRKATTCQLAQLRHLQLDQLSLGINPNSFRF
eukprot:TRINITY_DN41892_c0_g1_i1.p1 TRINITY_DN41892_c0_g1~~TRINITY_DN41892_c0_g1_i1.p1  ORF type:complete len:114 (+),score=3.02 TRINITY_DN41892_c0_g1_i1:164-505(+)